MIDPHFPPAPGEHEFVMVIRVHADWRLNRKIGLRHIQRILKSGVIRTTRIRALRHHEGWGFYFHGIRRNAWRSVG